MKAVIIYSPLMTNLELVSYQFYLIIVDLEKHENIFFL